MSYFFDRLTKRTAQDRRSDVLDQSLLPTWHFGLHEAVCEFIWEGIDCWTAGGCRAWINVSMSFNGSVSITTSIFGRMMRGWSCLMDRTFVTYFSVPCWRTGKNCVISESGYSVSGVAYVWGSLCRIHYLPCVVSANVCFSVYLHAVRLCPE